MQKYSEQEEKATHRDKLKRIEEAPIGTIVAFKKGSDKVKSAKIINKNLKGKKLKLETDYGVKHIVSFDDIIWVKSENGRWPRGVYNLLKGISIN